MLKTSGHAAAACASSTDSFAGTESFQIFAGEGGSYAIYDVNGVAIANPHSSTLEASREHLRTSDPCLYDSPRQPLSLRLHFSMPASRLRHDFNS